MFMKQTKVLLILTIVLSLMALASACGKKAEEGPAANTETTAKKFAAKGNEGTISGAVAFTGTPPAPKKIATDADPACGQKNPNLATEDNVVTNGKLANVLVYIKEGTLADGTKIGDWTFDTPTTASTLDQNGCHYKPHVSAVMVNQKLNITNSDPTQHNIHFTPKNNPDWNQSQPNGAAALSHSFAAVTAEDGSFSIKGVPPGAYTVVAWHEGGTTGTEKTMQVTVPASGSATADFAFGEAATASRNPSLQMMPALDVPMLGRH